MSQELPRLDLGDLALAFIAVTLIWSLVSGADAERTFEAFHFDRLVFDMEKELTRYQCTSALITGSMVDDWWALYVPVNRSDTGNLSC